MRNDIAELNPREVWRHFHALTRIPRPSGSEEKIRDFLVQFGKSLALESSVDEAGNVIIRKAASAGMENRKGVILQSHLDMVPQKNIGKLHDFECDPIDARVDGEWVRAEGTTLGADNGLGVAAAMAVLASTTLQHGPIEALFTSDEERGMSGAIGLKPSFLKGGILLNLDSEEEGELFIGCAGGTNATMTFTFEQEPLEPGYRGFKISVTGLKGGHSGMDIHLGRGNANKIMNRILFMGEQEHGLRLASIEGGSLRNAIPRESIALAAIPAAQTDLFLDRLAHTAVTIKRELSAVEPTLQIEAFAAGLPERVMDGRVFKQLLRALYACPDGVMRMSDEMAGLVETSTNLAIVRTERGVVTVECLLRSSLDSARADLAEMIRSLFDLAGASSLFHGAYPGWKPNPGSAILKIMQEVYQRKFGHFAGIKAVHAGLECGILGAAYPGLDMISFGPTIRSPHSPDERVNIASVLKFWEFLTETLRNIPVG